MIGYVIGDNKQTNFVEIDIQFDAYAVELLKATIFYNKKDAEDYLNDANVSWWLNEEGLTIIYMVEIKVLDAA